MKSARLLSDSAVPGLAPTRRAACAATPSAVAAGLAKDRSGAPRPAQAASASAAKPGNGGNAAAASAGAAISAAGSASLRTRGAEAAGRPPAIAAAKAMESACSDIGLILSFARGGRLGR
ncbi:MAG: hypothetical protein KGJ45_04965 [Elusimicrobia bacterium]|nr:hypothetical protein [Elusimicrobiota bacterium]